MSESPRRRVIVGLVTLGLAVAFLLLASMEHSASPSPSSTLAGVVAEEALAHRSSAGQEFEPGAPPRGPSGALTPTTRAEPASGATPQLTALPTTADGGPQRPTSCVLDSDCPATFACLREGPADERHCVPADCEEDAHCPTGFVCRTANLPVSGPPIRRCMVVGERRRGEPCSPTPESKERACAEGLLCSFLTCGVPCTPGQADAGCDEGELCLGLGLSLDDGAACYRPCTKTSCPVGLRCVALSGAGLARCSEVLGGDCHENPCPQGQECLTHFTETTAQFECLSPCNALVGPPCPPGLVCGARVGAQAFCYESCAPDASADGCPPGKRCVPVSEDERVFGCRAR